MPIWKNVPGFKEEGEPKAFFARSFGFKFDGGEPAVGGSALLSVHCVHYLEEAWV